MNLDAPSRQWPADPVERYFQSGGGREAGDSDLQCRSRLGSSGGGSRAYVFAASNGVHFIDGHPDFELTSPPALQNEGALRWRLRAPYDERNAGSTPNKYQRQQVWRSLKHTGFASG